jgi:hypothetical protein
MCEKCQAIDGKIQHYRDLVRRIPDQITEQEAEKLIQDLRVEKDALHQERSESAGQNR